MLIYRVPRSVQRSLGSLSTVQPFVVADADVSMKSRLLRVHALIPIDSVSVSVMICAPFL